MNKADYIAKAKPENHCIEQCAELIQAVCKAGRFGWFNFNNFDDVMNEMDDVVSAIERLQVHMREVKHQHFLQTNCGVKP